MIFNNRTKKMEPKKTVYRANCTTCNSQYDISEITKVIEVLNGDESQKVSFYCDPCYDKHYTCEDEEVEGKEIPEGTPVEKIKCDGCYNEFPALEIVHQPFGINVCHKCQGKYVRSRCDACSKEVTNWRSLKELDIHLDQTTIKNCLICKDCWFDKLENVEEGGAISKAARRNKPMVLKFLLRDHRLDPNEEYGDAIYFMCKYGNEEIVKILLEDKRVDPTATCTPSNALDIAYYRGYKIVEMLLKDGRCDPNVLGSKLWDILLEINKVELMEQILKDERVKIEKEKIIKMVKQAADEKKDDMFYCLCKYL